MISTLIIDDDINYIKYFINNIINQIKEMKKNETDIINNVINSIVLN